MASFTISDADKEKIAQNLKEFLEDEGIKGEFKLEFTDSFTPEGGGSEDRGPCWVTLPDGRRLIQNPCQQ